MKSDADFITALGIRPTGHSINQILKEKLMQLGVKEKGVSVHALRHFFVSAYNAANQNDLIGFQSITGHASFSTLSIYTHSKTNPKDFGEDMHFCEKSLEMVSVVLRTNKPKLLIGRDGCLNTADGSRVR